jgi:site-specific recombinase XerD
MKVQQAADYFIDYHKANSKKKYDQESGFRINQVSTRFLDEFADRKLKSISSDEILSFLNRLTRGQKQTTKRIRYANLKTFFNFVISIG